MFGACSMQHKFIVVWLTGLLSVLVVACAGAWSLTVATAYAYGDEVEKAETAARTVKTVSPESATKIEVDDSGSAADSKANAATTAVKEQPADEAPGVYQLPLRAKASRAADPATITPATFTIVGKKFLSGRPLEEGEFAFDMAKLGAYTVPAGSKLPSQLRSTTLSAAEKFDLVAHGGLRYLNSAVQPLPDPSTVTNAADGTVSFGPITINASMLGERATQRTMGVIFAYTFAEEPPRNADGTLASGVSKDSLGRYVYNGVTYDDTLKRAYLYAYQDYDADKNPMVKIIPLGDATFHTPPTRDSAGLGVGFRNTYNGAVIDDYDGAVYLEGHPIAAGEFNFAVHEVTEDGSLVDNEMVSCDESEGGRDGAEVPVLNGQQMNQAGRYYFTVSQTIPSDAAPANVDIDTTSYAVTVDVEADAQGKLSAHVTAVRKMAEGSDEWTNEDVDNGTTITPLVWENKVRADEPTTPDDATAPDDPAAPGESTAPDDSSKSDDSATPAPDDKPGADEAPDSGTLPSDESTPAEGDAASGEEAPSQPGHESSIMPGNGAAEEAGSGPSVDNAGAASVTKPGGDPTKDETVVVGAEPNAPEKTEVAHASSPQNDDSPLVKFLAQTDDSATGLMAVLVMVVAGGAGVLVVACRRHG